MEMRRPPRVRMIEPRIGAGLDREITIFTLLIGHAASRADEIRIQRRIMLVDGMMITAGGVRLPNLDERIWHWPSPFLQHASDDNDPLAHRFFVRTGGPREIVFSGLQFDVAKKRPGNLRQRLLDRHELLQRPALHRRTVRFENVRRMGFPIARLVFQDFHNAITSELIWIRFPSLYRFVWR